MTRKKVIDEWSVPCPKCKVPAGRGCIIVNGPVQHRGMRTSTHKSRTELVKARSYEEVQTSREDPPEVKSAVEDDGVQLDLDSQQRIGEDNEPSSVSDAIEAGPATPFEPEGMDDQVQSSTGVHNGEFGELLDEESGKEDEKKNE